MPTRIARDKITLGGNTYYLPFRSDYRHVYDAMEQPLLAAHSKEIAIAMAAMLNHIYPRVLSSSIQSPDSSV